MEQHLKELEKSNYTFEMFNAILHAQFTLAQRIPTAPFFCQILIFNIMLIYTIPLSPTCLPLHFIPLFLYLTEI